MSHPNEIYIFMILFGLTGVGVLALIVAACQVLVGFFDFVISAFLELD